MAQAYTKTTWVPNAPPGISADRLNNIETGIFLSSAPLVTSLPSTPVDGQECNYLADAVNGVVWHLVYRSAETGAYKWYFTGGSMLGVESTVNQGPIATTAYQNLTPTLVLPLAGDYDIEPWTQQCGGDAVGGYGYICYKIGATEANDADALVKRAGDANNAFTSLAFRRRKTGLAAGTTLQMRSRCSSGNFYPNGNGALAFGLRAWPVRVG
jgi:hypothetical protein